MGYSYQGPMENTAKAKSTRLQVSAKKTTETCNAIKGKKLNKALNYLERVKNHEEHIPFKKHNKHMPHRKNGQPGGYPEKPIKKVEETIQNALANAEYEGLNKNNLKIVHAVAYKSGSIQRRPKKLRRKSTALTTIEIVLKEEND